MSSRGTIRVTIDSGATRPARVHSSASLGLIELVPIMVISRLTKPSM
jgi:hypothetical protein